MINYPRIRNLPKEHQEPFREFLRGRQVPLETGYEHMPASEWDWYYPSDYAAFLRKR